MMALTILTVDAMMMLKFETEILIWQKDSFYSVNWIVIGIVTSHVVTCVYLYDSFYAVNLITIGIVTSHVVTCVSLLEGWWGDVKTLQILLAFEGDLVRNR